MTIDFLIGAIRASRDLHPQVKTELEEILVTNEIAKKRIQEKQEKISEGYYTVKDFMEMFGLTKETTYRICREKNFPSIRIGGQYFIPKERLTEWLISGGSKRKAQQE